MLCRVEREAERAFVSTISRSVVPRGPRSVLRIRRDGGDLLGERVFGHTPPEYFLAKNYQQELNLLDPWNLPYWVRDTCDDFRGRRVVFIYSFGPNRSRDSTPWEILGDDVGVFLVEEEAERYRP